MTNQGPVEPEPKFLEANPVLTRTGFQCKTGIPARTRIYQMKFQQKPDLYKGKQKNEQA